MKARKMIMLALACLAMHFNASAGDLSTGLFNSVKGFGLSIDYDATEDIYNSYTVYADLYGMYSGVSHSAGIKFVYLHYNRLTHMESPNAKYDIYLGPGASTGYVRDNGAERFGLVLTADLAVALRVSFNRSLELELGTVAELGFTYGESDNKSQLDIYANGLMQALLPTLKIMVRF
ncbi:MAG: hypothetical protein IKZ60_04170 [Bacteroidales bacterium]|nr:hypothetical protein [Bacteroidales bacterium]